jgi:chromosome segregation ATPase
MIFASAFFFVATSQAQDLNKQTTKPVRQTPKVVGPEKVEPEVVQETSEELLRKAITTLTEQVDKLTAEVKKMRQDSERNSTLLELSLLEERLTRIEDKLDAATSTKANLEAQDIDIQRRQRNVQQELILRGGALRREEAEAALRQEFQRTLDSIRSQQSALQTRISDLQSQADRLRFRIETLRKKAERLELKNESQQDK